MSLRDWNLFGSGVSAALGVTSLFDGEHLAAALLILGALGLLWSCLRDSSRLPKGEDSRSEAECGASQSGGSEASASPETSDRNPQ